MKSYLRRPLVLLCFYVFLIFLFGTIYYEYFPDQFYHSTLKYEPEFRKAAERALQLIDTSIVNNFKSVHDTLDIEIHKEFQIVYLSIDKLNLDNLSVAGDKIYFNGYFNPSVIYHYGVRMPTIYTYIFEINTNPTKTGFSPFGKTLPITVYADVSNPIDGNLLLPSKDSSQKGSIKFDFTTLNLFSYLTEREHGIIRQNNFLRMIYFSAITITTIGYGDIVPLTNTLRMIISIEAILGIIFIGLFIGGLGEWLKSK